MSGEQLERRYRRLLRILPKPYRQARGEELLSALMDGAAEGRRRPELREVLSLARLGVRTRLGTTVDRGQAGTRTGEMARAVAIAGTMLLAFVGVAQLATLANVIRLDPDAVVTWSHPFVESSDSAPAHTIFSQELPAGWLIVLALITVGWWRTARVSALVLFLLSLCLTDGTMRAVSEETVLAGVVGAALFAVRGGQGRPVVVPGSAVLAALVGYGAWTYKEPLGSPARPPMKAFQALQAFGNTENRHAMVIVAVAVAVVCVVAYRSAVWPVAIAVVALAALGPVLIRMQVVPMWVRGDQEPLAFLAGGLVLVAALAVLKEWRAGRAGRSERSERPENPVVAS